MHQAVDFVTDMFGDQLDLIAATMFSCIQLEQRIIACSTYGSIAICDLFVQDLNRLFVRSTGRICAYSLNSDSRNLALLKSGNPENLFSSQFDMVAKEGDLLLLAPAEATVRSERPDLGETAILKLAEHAKNLKLMTICLSSMSKDEAITAKLGSGSINVNYSAVGDSDISSLMLMYMLQRIMRSLKQQFA